MIWSWVKPGTLYRILKLVHEGDRDRSNHFCLRIQLKHEQLPRPLVIDSNLVIDNDPSSLTEQSKI